MKINLEKLRLIEDFAPNLGGVFTLDDLRATFAATSTVSLYRTIKDLENANVLKRFTREIYVTEDHRIDMLSQKLCSNSYISFGNVLAEASIIGTQPKNHIMAVKIGKKRIYENNLETIIQVGISHSLFFGTVNKNGIHYAIPEKAFLDTLYFYLKGYKFFFDIYSDLNLTKLDKNLVQVFLKKYKNPKFKSFVNSIVNHV